MIKFLWSLDLGILIAVFDETNWISFERFGIGQNTCVVIFLNNAYVAKYKACGASTVHRKYLTWLRCFKFRIMSYAYIFLVVCPNCILVVQLNVDILELPNAPKNYVKMM